MTLNSDKITMGSGVQIKKEKEKNYCFVRLYP